MAPLTHSDTFSPTFKTSLQRHRTDFQGICNAEYISITFLLINVNKFQKLVLGLIVSFISKLEKSIKLTERSVYHLVLFTF